MREREKVRENSSSRKNNLRRDEGVNGSEKKNR